MQVNDVPAAKLCIKPFPKQPKFRFGTFHTNTTFQNYSEKNVFKSINIVPIFLFLDLFLIKKFKDLELNQC